MAGPILADRVRETTSTTGTGAVSLGGAEDGFQSFVAGVGNGNSCHYGIAGGSEWEVGIGTVTDASPDTLSRDEVIASSNGGALVNFSAGTKDVFLTLPARAIVSPIGLCQGRLTVTSGTPITTSNVTAAGTLYFTPHHGNNVALYSGSGWGVFPFTERSLALTITSGKNYDVFVYDNGGTPALELSAAWTDDTTRADALALQDGVYVKSGAPTRRYVGTIRATGANTTEDSTAKRFVWNFENRTPRKLYRKDPTATWTYNLNAWRQARASADNKVEVVVGIAGATVDLQLNARADASGDNGTGSVQIGIDSTTIPSGDWAQYGSGSTGMPVLLSSGLKHQPAAGYHYYAWLEYKRGGTSGGQNVTFVGDVAVDSLLYSALHGTIEGRTTQHPAPAARLAIAPRAGRGWTVTNRC